MNNKDMIKYRRVIWNKLDDIAVKKGKDYSGMSGDTFKNIRLCENYGIPAEIGLLIRVGDKYSRISELLTRDWLKKDGAAVSDEKIEDTLLDAINYLSYIILIRNEKNGIYNNDKK